MIIYEISQRVANSISRELGYSEEKKEIISYGIESVILALLGLVAIISIALPLNVLYPTIIAAVFGGALRKVSGGAHFNTPFKCLAFGAVVYPLLGILAKGLILYELYNQIIYLLTLIICLIFVIFLAPVDSDAKPIHSQTFKKKLKIASTGFVIFTCIIIVVSSNRLINTAAVLGIVYQTITLLPVFNKKQKEVSV